MPCLPLGGIAMVMGIQRPLSIPPRSSTVWLLAVGRASPSNPFSRIGGLGSGLLRRSGTGAGAEVAQLSERFGVQVHVHPDFGLVVR